jgi:hypothetical protein
MFVGLALLIFTGCGGETAVTSVTPAVHNEWTWIDGANSRNQLGSYGTQGTASSVNTPGARVNQSSGSDGAGTFWLFGGYGYAAGTAGDLNDLWQYSNGMWTWVSGSSETEQPGTFGTKGVPAPTNVPGARLYGVSWTDPQGNFWLFGGIGIDSTGARGELNDLWRYRGGQWTWMAGSNLSTTSGFIPGQPPGIYGTKGVGDPGNTPGARFAASSWSDAAGNLWLFGGNGFDSAPATSFEFGGLNDLWKYSGGKWTWMSGSNIINQPGWYGNQGLTVPGNIPGQRYNATGWTDPSGNLWLFGGGIYLSGGGSFNDLWEYQP